jgi:hypothetical protein
VAGYEKLVLDCEVLGMLHIYFKGVDWWMKVGDGADQPA